VFDRDAAAEIRLSNVEVRHAYEWLPAKPEGD
jgi:hypothetical protein